MANMKLICKANRDRLQIIKVLQNAPATCKGLSFGLGITVFSMQTSLNALYASGYVHKKRLDGRTWIYSINHHQPYPYETEDEVISQSKAFVSEMARNAARAKWEQIEKEKINKGLEVPESTFLRREKSDTNPNATVIKFGKLPPNWNMASRQKSMPFMESASGYLSNFA